MRSQSAGWILHHFPIRRIGAIALLAGVVAGAGGQRASADITTGLVSQWTFEGSNSNDSIGTNNATATGTPTYVSDGVRGGTVLEVSSGNYVTVPSPTGLPTGSAAKTASFWSRIDTYPNDGGPFRWGANSNQNDFSVETTTTPGTVTFNGWAADFDFSMPSGPNDWHMITVTYDGTTVTAYVDGASRGSANLALNTANAGPRFGGPRLDGSSNQINGRIDDVRIYSRALSSGDVAQLYTASVPEPASLCMLALGTLGLLARRRRA